MAEITKNVGAEILTHQVVSHIKLKRRSLLNRIRKAPWVYRAHLDMDFY